MFSDPIQQYAWECCQRYPNDDNYHLQSVSFKEKYPEQMKVFYEVQSQWGRWSNAMDAG